MNHRRSRPRPPLDPQALREIALAYVGRFATSRAKLAIYLRRKLRERGWAGEGDPGVDLLVERFAEMGYVDDAAFAVAKSRSLIARGYGARRLQQSLAAAGIGEDEGREARAIAAAEAVEAAVRFARRRRFGPFASARTEREQREKALAAMVRAGHDFTLARRIVELEPGELEPLDELKSEVHP